MYFCGLISFAHSSPLRCRKTIINFILQPVLYVAFTAPLPEMELEYSIRRRLVLAFQLCILAATCFVLQSNTELAERKKFLFTELFKDGYIREKALRFEFEHKAESAAAGSNERRRDSDHLSSQSSGRGTEAASEFSSVVFRVSANLHRSQNSKEHVFRELRDFGRSEKWLLDSQCLEILPSRILGHGGFAAAAIGKMHGLFVAVKIPLSFDTAARMKSLANELRILRSMRHPRIVAFLGMCIDAESEELVLVEELVYGRTLDNFISPPPGDPAEPVRHRILLDVCAAVNYMHHHTPVVVHGDLKPGNVLDEALTFRPKLIDFGLSRRYSKRDRMVGGTPLWMAPEVLLSSAQARLNKLLAVPSADIFAVGAIAFFIATGTKPFAGVSLAERIELAKRGKCAMLKWPKSEVPWWSQCMELANACVAFDSSQRPTIVEVQARIESWVPESTLVDMTDPGEALVYW
eukprot:CAMPEP_0117559628 /NCGR_PEP_ID=MMETSP0784-20121206/53460_1 /TAXON_ID=39447 /ORGANISM="" /LENGTH=463 /DNA_ID=CAMNT_0005357015 /DNA_START=540 /DNA_END=1928 /DNA_ORIENTATION=-